MIVYLQSFSALFAFAAGVLWLYASRIPTPPKLEAIMLTDKGFIGELPELFMAVAKQSKWNAKAAGAASAAAVFQAIAIAAESMK